MTHEELIARAIFLATENAKNGGGPFGAVIARNGEIISEGVNRVTANNDPTAHAEVQAIRSATARLNVFDLTGYDIYASCEPCPMCLGAIYWAHLDRLFFAADKNDAARAGFDDAFIYREIALPYASRSLATRILHRNDSKEPFLVWRNKEDKIEY